MKTRKVFLKKENFSDDYAALCLKGTLKQRLEWLEEASEFVRMVQINKRGQRPLNKRMVDGGEWKKDSG